MQTLIKTLAELEYKIARIYRNSHLLSNKHQGRVLKPLSHISTDERGSVLDPSGSISGTIFGRFGLMSVNGLPKTITQVTTGFRQGQTRTNTNSPAATRGLFQPKTAEIGKAPDKHGPTSHIHGPSRT
ncbi:hypothetical protein DPMN_056636 [Dreissena polymorpha]|uniref:Uncharacterized protein n=1 Tax=Dreissena polymorpha TaxID=45954 RepID=A0A9D4HTS9_DREPO|nr:hypothetical protein DPMN_056636 [Dreissena polymorpha]